MNINLTHADMDGELTEENLSIDISQYSLIGIENVEETEELADVYDLKMAGEPNYVLEGGQVAHNGGGKRKGSIAVYIEPWHSDIFDFLDLRKNHGKEELRARDLFLALWIPDLFMKRIEENGKWTLFSPDEAPGLHETYGEEFEALYEKYESEGRGRRTIEARILWEHIVTSQIETGTPYMLYKDHANKKNNQKNLGTLHGSNLCLSGGTEVRVRVNGEETSCNMIELHSWIERSLPVEILSMNTETGENEWKEVYASTIMNPSAEVIEIEDENGNVLRCTPDHKIWTMNRGYVMAKNLEETDQLQISEIMEYTMDI
jgi:hypothetical protein